MEVAKRKLAGAVIIFLLHLALVFATAFLLICTYNRIINYTTKQQVDSANKTRKLEHQISAIENMQAELKKPRTTTQIKGMVTNYDKQYGANLYAKIKAVQLLHPDVAGKTIDQTFAERGLSRESESNQEKLTELKNKGFWDYLPCWPALLFSFLGTILICVINDSYYGIVTTHPLPQ